MAAVCLHRRTGSGGSGAAPGSPVGPILAMPLGLRRADFALIVDGKGEQRGISAQQQSSAGGVLSVHLTMLASVACSLH